MDALVFLAEVEAPVGVEVAVGGEGAEQDLVAVGITVQLQGQSIEVALNSYRDGQEPTGLWYWGPDFPDPSDYLNFLPGALVGLRAGWAKGSDPSLSSLGTTAASTTAKATRETLYQQIQRP